MIEAGRESRYRALSEKTVATLARVWAKSNEEPTTEPRQKTQFVGYLRELDLIHPAPHQLTGSAGASPSRFLTHTTSHTGTHST